MRRLRYAPPAIGLMAQLRVAATDAAAAGAFLEEPWRALLGVARSISDQAVQSEYDTLAELKCGLCHAVLHPLGARTSPVHKVSGLAGSLFEPALWQTRRARFLPGCGSGCGY